MVTKKAKIAAREQAASYGGKHAVVAQSIENEGDARRVSWRFGDADLNGRWAWTPERLAERTPEILGFMAEMDKLTWARAQQEHRPRSKRVDVSGTCDDAQARLVAMGQEELDSLEEWHLSGEERIWGIRNGHVCHVLWWDPDHTVWRCKPR